MKRIVLAALLIPTAAIAQQHLTPLQTMDALVHQADEREIAAVMQVTQLQGQIAAKDKEIADLTKERDALKAAAKPTEPARPAEPAK